MEVKIPYPLPYAANHTSFERFDGEIEFNGVHYNYVKRKMVNDTLVILCIPNTIKTELNKAKSDLVAGFNNISTESPTDNKSPEASVIKLFKAESKPNNNEFNFSIISDSEKRNYFSFQSVVLTPVLQAQDRPPQL